MTVEQVDVHNVENNRYIIIGAGPVGLLAAILLVQEKHAAQVSIYEARDGLTTDLHESYPIGVNPRGSRALDRARPDMAIALRMRSSMIDAWRIYAGSRMVAEVPSGLVVGTTRSTINEILYEEVCKHFQEQIKILWSHRLKTLDILERSLIFDVKRPRADEELAKTYEEVTVQGGGARVLACDGVWSVVRGFAEKHVEGFTSNVSPWRVQFRLLFSKPGAGKLVPELEPRYHYVMGGIYLSIIEEDVWVLGLGIGEHLPRQTRELLTATVATPERIAALRAYVTKKAPLAAPFLTAEDLELYFTRKTFGGAMVKVSQLNIGEWAVLLGDAAHSVIPPTGEGFNSGAEDVEILMEALRLTPAQPFRAFNEMRLPDLHALHNLAVDANESNFGKFGPEKVSRLLATVLVALAKRVGIFSHTWEDLSFGADASPPKTYIEIASVWRWQRIFILPLSRSAIWPIFLLVWLLLSPFRAIFWVVRRPYRKVEREEGSKSSFGGRSKAKRI